MRWPEEERAELGAALRQLRRRSGLTAQELAEKISSNQPKISRIETGRTTPSVEDVRRIATALDAPPELTTELVARAERIQNELQSVRALLRRGLAQRQKEVGEREAATTSIKEFQHFAVPGLLQTAEYARRVFDTWPPLPKMDLPGKDLASAVATRLQRQEALYDESKSFSFIVTDAALRLPVGPAELMRIQLDRLVSLSALPNVSVAVWTTDRQVGLLPYSSFAVYDDELVSIELFHGGIELREPRDVALYVEAFEVLRGEAAGGDAGRAAIRAIASSL